MMQQTDKYKLNLIEKDDVFSPDPLNENMEKVEAAISAEAAAEAAARTEAVAAEAQARADAVAALGQRIQTLELHKFVSGTAPGSGVMALGFTPKFLVAAGSSGYAIALLTYRQHANLYIVEGGFEHDGIFADCRYVAFA